ncbi:hypothetical protein ABCR94_00930 [Streptomyces sp. 21So2-11]|uniref:hypothetical protein n=1 Tax=Streptomyces sp. 21So2-11 TaxID=3144408 RepID=UPI00321A5A5A
MLRNVLGWILALVGATAAVLSPFHAWHDGRHGRDYRIQDLFSGITGTSAELVGSIILPFVFAAVVTLIGLLLRSRLLVAFAGIVVLGFTILWMVRVGMAEGSLAVNSDGTGLKLGVAYALGGGVLLLLAAGALHGRHRPGRHRYDSHAPGPAEPTGPAYPVEEEPRPRHPTLDGPQQPNPPNPPNPKA